VVKALIDGDIVVYRIAHTTVNEHENIAAWRVGELIRNIISDTGARDFHIYLSDSTANNFRTRLYPEYKANRPKEKPPHYNFLREYLVREFGATVSAEEEADDRLGIDQVNGLRSYDPDPGYWDQPDYATNTILCSIDKDLRQIPGWHYHFVNKAKYWISTHDALHWFYMQLVMGDMTENVPGIVGIGEARARKILDGAVGEAELFSRVVHAYKKWFAKIGRDETEMMDLILTYGRVLKIRQEEEEIWNFPDTNTTTPLPLTEPQ